MCTDCRRCSTEYGSCFLKVWFFPRGFVWLAFFFKYKTVSTRYPSLRLYCLRHSTQLRGHYVYFKAHDTVRGDLRDAFLSPYRRHGIAHAPALLLTSRQEGGIRDPAVTRCQVEPTRTDLKSCLLYTSPSPRDGLLSRMPSSA